VRISVKPSVKCSADVTGARFLLKLNVDGTVKRLVSYFGAQPVTQEATLANGEPYVHVYQYLPTSPSLEKNEGKNREMLSGN
jgi:hypothetical protein